MTGTLADFWIDGAKRPKRGTERLDRERRRLIAPKRLTGAVFRGPGGAIALDLPDDPGIRYVLDEVLTRDCNPVVPEVASIATIVVIGASVGIAASRFRLAYPQARILCFEPNPATLAYLRFNAPRARAELFVFGLGDADARLPLFQGTHSNVTASLSPRAMTRTEPLGAVEIRAADGALAGTGVTTINLLKIDTEAAELPVLKALASFLPGVRIAHREFHGEADRRATKSLFAPTHLLRSGTIESGATGRLTYLRRDLAL